MQIPSKAIRPEPSTPTRNIAIVDDSLLARSMFAKYVDRESSLNSLGCFSALSDITEHIFENTPDCIMVSLRKFTAVDETAAAEFATRFPNCWAVIVDHPNSQQQSLLKHFARRNLTFSCGADERASVLAQQMLQHLKNCLPITLPSSQPAGVTASNIAAPAKAETTIGLRDRESSPRRTITTPSPDLKGTISNKKDRAQKSSRRTTSGLPTRLVVIGGSTGAPAAVTKLLQQLPADFPLPIAVSLHMLEDFTGRLAQSLDRSTKLRCQEATDNELMQPSTVYIARGDHHLTIEKNSQGRFVSRLNRQPPEHFARPSVNQLFRSAAIAAGPGTAAIILTGIGSDGLEGCEMLAHRGGLIIAQDQASSTVWGMPAAVIQAGLAREILSPGEAGQFIAMKIAVEAKRQHA